MSLRTFQLPRDDAPLPPAVSRLLADANARVDAWFAAPGRVAGAGFVPSDFETGFRALRALRTAEPFARRFCEWGSGFGAVTALAAMLGFDAYGIEIDGELVAASRELLARHRLRATIAHGSFVPPEYAARERLSDLETRTVLAGPDAYADLDVGIDDFEVVFAYPWPTEEALYRDLFRQHADFDAVLLTYSATEGVRACRKVAARRR